MPKCNKPMGGALSNLPNKGAYKQVKTGSMVKGAKKRIKPKMKGY